MKTKEELKALKEEAEALNKKLAELSETELEQVAGGVVHPVILDMLDFEPAADEPSVLKPAGGRTE